MVHLKHDGSILGIKGAWIRLFTHGIQLFQRQKVALVRSCGEQDKPQKKELTICESTVD